MNNDQIQALIDKWEAEAKRLGQEADSFLAGQGSGYEQAAADLYKALHGYDQRNYDIYLMRKEGQTFSKIGEKYGISGARVNQIYNKVRRKLEKIARSGHDET